MAATPPSYDVPVTVVSPRRHSTPRPTGWSARRGAVVATLLALAVRLLGLSALAVAPSRRALDGHGRLVRWDAQWYAGIAEHGYGFTRARPDGRLLSDYAFFPLYPMLERGLSVFGLTVLHAGLVIS